MSISNVQELKLAIKQLEAKSKKQEEELKLQFKATAESLKPGNLIRSSLEGIPAAAVIGTILKTAGSLGVGMLTSKIVGAGAAASTGRKLVGGLLNQTATQAVSHNVDTIKAYALAILHSFSKKK